MFIIDLNQSLDLISFHTAKLLHFFNISITLVNLLLILTYAKRDNRRSFRTNYPF